ncbi:MAG TPA: NAD(P)/FAD-dependent oxidoreductase [Chitinispirillaceae bacterium]|nr:NAD(P)/FAD-dependent oxidoreductase [Chitinispirillaceae bacterium]
MDSYERLNTRMKITVAGGGAAGIFAAISCKEKNSSADITVLEQGDKPLVKVALSGGGRCNLTNSITDPVQLSTFYPRGSRELIGPFQRFNSADTVNWFQSHGVSLKREPDGRVFPESDKSESIVKCLLDTAEKTGVKIRKNCGLTSAITSPQKGGFDLLTSDGSSGYCDLLLLATGGSPDSAGIRIAASVGHTIIDQIPSLFSFVITDSRISSIPGISLQKALISLPQTRFSSAGPVLITHNGISGPAVLKLSSLAARELHAKEYKTTCRIDWFPDSTLEQTLQILSGNRKLIAGKKIFGEPPLKIPRRLWNSLAEASGCGSDQHWADLSKKQAAEIAAQIHKCELKITGKDRNKEEFVTCGGVKLSEISFKTMQSKLYPSLFFAGELLDIDGLTGGFNLQAAWTTGWIAGEGMALFKQ